jgi:hypothetical protein
MGNVELQSPEHDSPLTRRPPAYPISASSPRRQDSASLDVLREPAGRFPRERRSASHLRACCFAAKAMGLVKGEGFAVDASVMEANASRYHGKAPGELDWSGAHRQKRAVAEYFEASKRRRRQGTKRTTKMRAAGYHRPVCLDGQGQQACTLRLRPQLPDRHRARGHRRCRGNAGTHLR